MTFAVIRLRAASVVALAALLVASATLFGFEFASEAHTHGEHAHAEHAAGEEAEGAEGEEAEHAEGEEAEHAEGEGTEDDGDAGEVTSAILIGFAGGALAPLSALLLRRRDDRFEVQGPAGMAISVPTALLVVLAALSVGAATIHFAVIAQHLDEWWLTGTFFVVVALFQLAWGLLVLLRPFALVLLSGAVVNALVVATWIVSRTTGVPVGPEAGEAESVGFPDALATGFEAVLVVLAVVVLVRHQVRVPRPWAAARGSWLAGGIVASLTALALALLP
jgi:hypothetical protein